MVYKQIYDAINQLKSAEVDGWDESETDDIDNAIQVLDHITTRDPKDPIDFARGVLGSTLLFSETAIDDFNNPPIDGDYTIPRLYELACEVQAILELRKMDENNLDDIKELANILQDTASADQLAEFKSYFDESSGISRYLDIVIEHQSTTQDTSNKLDSIKKEIKNLVEQYVSPVLLPEEDQHENLPEIQLPSEETSGIKKRFFMEVDNIHFKDQRVKRDDMKNWSPLAPDAFSNVEVETSENGSTHIKYKNEELEPGDAIFSVANFSDNKKVILKQDYTGKVTDMTSKEVFNSLTDEEKIATAIKQARMLLANCPSGTKTIIISKGAPEQANRVYAALLLLKDSDPALKTVKIESHVLGCDGPVSSRFRTAKGDREAFVKEHLKEHVGGKNNPAAEFSVRLKEMKTETGDGLTSASDKYPRR